MVNLSLARLLRTSSFRMAALFSLIFSLSASALLGFVYWSSVGYMSSQAESTVDAEIQGLAERYRDTGLDGLATTIRERLADNPRTRSLYLFASPRYEPLAGNLDRWPTDGVSVDGWLEFQLEAPETSRRPSKGESNLARARVFELGRGLKLLVGRDMVELDRVRRLIGQAMAWGLLATVALGVVLGYSISRMSLRRVERIGETSRKIMQGQLSERVPTEGSNDEFDLLADSINEMLDRIEGLLSAVRDVSDNIAHDLRTPLARLRNTLERMRDELQITTTGPSELIDLVEQGLTEADRMMSMFAGLLRIARVESGTLIQRFAPIEIEATLRDVLELYEPLAQTREQHLSLELEPALMVDGDRDLVFQTLANVLDNACKYAPKASTIDILARRNTLEADGYGHAMPDGGTSILIRDRGPGIRSEVRERAFQRLSRLGDEHDTPPGHGLGLSLAQAVMRAHGGTISLADADPGLVVELRFPAPRR